MTFDWRYAWFNNTVTMPAFLIAAASFYFLGGSWQGWTLIGVEVVVYLIYYFGFKRRYLYKHPDYNRKNRTVVHSNFSRGSTALFVIILLMIINFVSNTAIENALFVAMVAVALFLNDGFTLPDGLVPKKSL